MIDSKTGERIIVQVHEKYGPYIRVATYDDAGALEDLFDDHYYILYWTTNPKELEVGAGHEYFFGGIADPVKLQRILDEIVFK